MPRRRRTRYQTPSPPAATRQEETASDRLKRWQVRAQRARALRGDWEQRYKVRQLEEAYLGLRGYDSVDQTVYNHFFATVRVQLPSLLYANPSFRVRQRRGSQAMGRRQAALMEAVLQAIAGQDDNLETDGKLALLQAFFRVGCLKVSYEPVMQRNPQAGKPLTVRVGDLDIPVMGDGETPMVEPDQVLSDEVYEWQWVDARRLLLPDEGPNPRRWTWIGEEVEVTLDEAQDDPRFPRSLRHQFVANAMVQADDNAAPSPLLVDGTSAAEQEAARFRYIECWDIWRQRLYIWAEGQPWSDERFLLEEDFPDGIEDHPYNVLAFLPIVGPKPSPWPKPFTYDWLGLQDDYNESRQATTNAGRRAARKYYYQADTFPDSEEARKALQSSVDMEAVEVTDVSKPPVVLPDVPLSQDVARSTAALQYDWRVITGAPGTRLSGTRDAHTATEAAFTERAANLRDSEQQLQVATWLARAGTKMLQLVRQTLTLDLYVSVRGYSDKEFADLLASPSFRQLLIAQFGPQLGAMMPQLLPMFPALQRQFRERLGEEKLLAVTREQLQWEVDVEVIPASLRVRTLESERASWLQFLTTIGQFPQLMLSRGLLEETAAKFDFLSDAMVDELQALGQQMMQAMQAQQAPRVPPTQGRATPPIPNGQLPVMSRGAL